MLESATIRVCADELSPRTAEITWNPFALGISIARFSVRPAPRELIDPADLAEVTKTHVILANGFLTLLTAVIVMTVMVRRLYPRSPEARNATAEPAEDTHAAATPSALWIERSYALNLVIPSGDASNTVTFSVK